MARHYGLDWLRIGAFALLIFYHVGMVFVPWNFHVKLAQADWVAVPMLALNPWRLALLFLVSGYASRALLARNPGAASFARSRSARLLIPLLFGALVVVPVQPWIEIVSKYGYPRGFWHFYFHDYFLFGTIADIVLPTWQHLWFVAYLWVYSMLLAVGVASLGSRVAAAIQRGYDRVFAGVGQFVLPTVWLVAGSVWLFPGGRETHAFFGDWVAHYHYLPAFLFGFAMAGSPRLLAGFARWWRPAAGVALIAYLVVVWVELRYPGDMLTPKPWGSIFSAARAVQGWATIAALVGVAETFWNRDHPWRATLTEAVFPFYIIHQTVIVVVAYWLLHVGLPLPLDFLILVAATVMGCWGFYLAGRRVRWLRPLIGLKASRT